MHAPLFSPKFTTENIGRTQNIIFFLLSNTYPICHRKTGASIIFHSADVVPSLMWPQSLSPLIFVGGQEVQPVDLSYFDLINWLSKTHFFPLETPVCFERTLAPYRAAHSVSLVGSPNETQNGTSVGVTHGVGGYRETEYGERVVIATERKE